MTRQKKIFITVFLACVCIGAVFKAGMIAGATGEDKPGSVNDPLITKSYLESYMKDMNVSGNKAGFEKVILSKGSTLVGKEGTQILLCKGSANSYVKGDNIVNITMGESYEHGTTLSKYCVYMCVDSSCGITATSEVTVFVNGGYTSN